MKQFRACIHPGDKRRTIGQILEACDPAKRTFYDTEYRIVRPADGAVRWMAAKGRAIFDDKRRLLCACWVSSWTSPRARRSRNRRARARRVYRTLFESIDEGFCIIERSWRRTARLAISATSRKIPALAARSGIVGVLGRTVREMLLPSEADPGSRSFAKVLTTGEPLRFERPLETTGAAARTLLLRVESKNHDQVAVLFQASPNAATPNGVCTK